MGMGIGKQYIVEQIANTWGDLETCIKWMAENKPKNEYQWYELRPIVNVKKKTCIEYQCILLKIPNKDNLEIK